MGKASHIIWLLALVGITAGCSGGCSNAKAGNNAPVTRRVEEKRTAIPVEAQLPVRGSISEYFDTTTRVTAERSVQVASEGMGKCLKVHVDEGDRVQKGDVLAELDPSELNAQLTSARTQLSKALADYERAKLGVADGIMPKVEYDNAKFAHDQQKASVEQLEVQLSSMTIRSPIDGIITKKLIQAGQFVGSSTPCFEVIDPQSYILTINAPEKDYLPRIKVGQKARVKLDSVDEELTAKVRKINPAVDSASGTVKVTLDFEKSALPKLRDQAFARVNVVLTTHEDALLLPKDVIMEENARKYVFVIERENGETPDAAPDTGAAVEKRPSEERALIAKRVEVKTGLEDSTHTEILEGISDNSLVVSVGQQTLKSGSEVKLTSMEDEILAKAGLSADVALQEAEAERDKEKESGGLSP